MKRLNLLSLLKSYFFSTTLVAAIIRPSFEARAIDLASLSDIPSWDIQAGSGGNSCDIVRLNANLLASLASLAQSPDTTTSLQAIQGNAKLLGAESAPLPSNAAFEALEERERARVLVAASSASADDDLRRLGEERGTILFAARGLAVRDLVSSGALSIDKFKPFWEGRVTQLLPDGSTCVDESAEDLTKVTQAIVDSMLPTDFSVSATPDDAPPQPRKVKNEKEANDPIPGVPFCKKGLLDLNKLPKKEAPTAQLVVPIFANLSPIEPPAQDPKKDTTCGCWYYHNKTWQHAPARGISEEACIPNGKPDFKTVKNCFKKKGDIPGPFTWCNHLFHYEEENADPKKCLLTSTYSGSGDFDCQQNADKTGKCQDFTKEMRESVDTSCEICQALAPTPFGPDKKYAPDAGWYQWTKICQSTGRVTKDFKIPVSCEEREEQVQLNFGTPGKDGLRIVNECTSDGIGYDKKPSCDRSCGVYRISARDQCLKMYPKIGAGCSNGPPDESPDPEEEPEAIPYPQPPGKSPVPAGPPAGGIPGSLPAPPIAPPPRPKQPTQTPAPWDYVNAPVTTSNPL